MYVVAVQINILYVVFLHFIIGLTLLMLLMFLLLRKRQAALQIQRDHVTYHKCEILHLKRLEIGEATYDYHFLLVAFVTTYLPLFSVYVTACDLEKSFNNDNKV